MYSTIIDDDNNTVVVKIYNNKTYRYLNNQLHSCMYNGVLLPSVCINNNIVKYHKCGVLHRDDGPAYISKKPHIRIWYQNGKVHRDGCHRNSYAYYIRLYNHEMVKKWYNNGLVHRCNNLPAVLKTRDRLNTKLYIQNGKYVANKSVECCYDYYSGRQRIPKYTYLVDSSYHDIYKFVMDKPSIIINKDNLRHEFYFTTTLHNLYGPSHIVYNNKTDKIVAKEYYINGKLYEKEEYTKIVHEKIIKLLDYVMCKHSLYTIDIPKYIAKFVV